MYPGNSYILVILSALMLNLATCRKPVYSNTWVVQVDGGHKEAERIAAEKDLTLLGQVGSLDGFYTFKHNTHPRRSRRSAYDITSELSDHPNVIWADQQIVKNRVKRYNPNLNDPDYSKQWFIHNSDSVFGGYDHNILSVWEQGVTGKNAVVSILDDGIEYSHKDLKDNYEPRASYDYNSNDNDPAPRKTWNDENRHGTRCAGEVAAVANNSVCGVGVAPGSKVGGVRMLDGDVTDGVEASSLSLNPQVIDIYSSSWGPDDDGRTVDGPAKLARKAFADGVKNGRGGLGSIYVWASGNGGRAHDSCSCDGYTNSIYTLSISSATEHGTSPWYSEHCASTLATTFSSGGFDMRKIVTTDLHGRCTDSHTGTSASAPLAAGILALALEVNPRLNWRDMQHLVVRTSSNAKLKSDDFVTNAVGRKVSHKFGYGLLDAGALVALARKWKTVPAQHVCREIPETQNRPVPGSGSLKVTIDATACSNNSNHVRHLEHVQVVLTLSCSRRGDLSIKLISPRGTPSIMLPQRREDYSASGFMNWEFMSTHSWGEDPQGTWTLEITNHGSSYNTGKLNNWYLVLFGTSDAAEPEKKPVPACNVECQNGCTGPRADQCTECKHFKSTTSNECVVQCTQSEYEDPVGKLCKPCSPTCAMCGGPSTDDCLSCHSPLILYNGSCVNFCPGGLYKHDLQDSNAVCLKCYQSCLTCAGNATSCTSCSPVYKHVLGSCVRRCDEGQYIEADGQCKPCHPSCLTCDAGSASSCTTCGIKDEQQSLFLHGGECKALCPLGFFGDAASHKCNPCDATCSGCTGSSSSECTSCNDGFYKLGAPIGTCIASCPEGHYAESSNRTCQPCQSQCKQCDQADPTKCTSCPENSFLQMHRCVSADQCAQGTYANITTRQCENCPIGCASCSSSSNQQCLSCSEGFHMYKSQCSLWCPDGTFPSNFTSCVPCNSACHTCFDEGDNQCLTCALPKVLSGSQCVTDCSSGLFHNHVTHRCEQCSPTCETCSGSSNNECISCKAGWNLNGTTCKPSCRNGMFNNGGNCTNCDSSCLVCHGATKTDCLSCSGIKFLDPGTKTCSYECPIGSYGDLPTTHCKPCSSGCDKCKNSAECITCKHGLLLVGNSCQTQCPQGFYRSKTNSCEPCDGMCEECIFSPGHCIKCRPHDVLSDGKCASFCPVGTYMTRNTKHCTPCHTSCKSCKGPAADDCIGCSSSSVMVESRCMASCPQQYFFDKEANRCQPCDYYCSTCDGGNGLQNCTKCIPPFVLNEHYCIRECPKHGWVLDSKHEKCIRCHSSCARCIGPTANDCIKCADDHMSLVGFTCKQDCPSGSFANQITGVCEICHPTCRTCSGPGAGDCDSCADDLVGNENTGMCSSVCPQGRYAVESECQDCHPNCKTCNGPGSSSCLSCQVGKFLYNNTCVSSCPDGTFPVDNDGIRWCRQCHPICQSCSGPTINGCSTCKTPLYLEDTVCVLRCSPNYSTNQITRSCHHCGNECKLLTRNKNRSVQIPSDGALEFVLQDPHKNRVSIIAIGVASILVVTFLIIFGVLHLRSSRRVTYTIIKASFSKTEDEDSELNEDRVSLMMGSEDDEEDRA